MSWGQHPHTSILQRFLLGKLDSASSNDIEHHVEHCAACLEKLDTLNDGDRVVELLQGPSDIDHAPHMKLPVEASNDAPESMPEIEGYDLLREIGRGGSGIVYQAYAHNLNRLVAVKVLLSKSMTDPSLVERFRYEAKALAQLQHRNIVQIFDVGESAACLYLVLEYIDGLHLDDYLKQNHLSCQSAAEMVASLADAVHFAHQRGILHRDLSPRNVLIDSTGTAKIVDFGLAKRLDAETAFTMIGTSMGTPDYMAPEQASGQSDVYAAADVYGLGAILYKCLTGHPPVQGKSWIDSVRRIVDVPPDSIRSRYPGVPRDLETICLTCLEKSPADRYSSAASLADDLKRFLRGDAILARPATVLEHLQRWAAKNRGLSVAVLLTALSLVGATVVSTSLWIRAKAESERAKTARDEAIRSQEERNHALTVATASQDRAWRNLYANQISQSWSECAFGNLVAAESLLDRIQNDPDLARFRGWEWDYVHRMCNNELMRLAPVQDTIIRNFSIDPTGTIVVSAQSHFKSAAESEPKDTLLVRDLRTGEMLATIDNIDAKINTLRFAAQRSEFVVTTADGRLILFELLQKQAKSAAESTRSEVSLEARHTITHLRNDSPCHLSPDGRYVAYVDHSEKCIIFDLQQNKVVSEYQSPDRIAGVAFDIEQQLLFVALAMTQPSAASTTVAYKKFDDEELTTWSYPHAYPMDATFVSGKFALAMKDGLVAVFQHGQPPKIIKNNSQVVTTIALSPTGEQLAIGHGDGRLSLWDVQFERRIASFYGHWASIKGIEFSADCSLLSSSSIDGTIRSWDLTRPASGNLFHFESGVSCMAVEPTSQTLITASHGLCQGIDLTTGEVQYEVPIRTNARNHWPRHDFRMHPQARWLAAPGESAGTITLFNPRSGASEFVLTYGSGRLSALCWSPGGSWLAAATCVGAGRDAITTTTVWDCEQETPVPLQVVELAGAARSIGLSSDGLHLAVGLVESQEVKLIDVERQQVVETLTGLARPYGLRFHPRKPILAIAEAGESQIHLWDVVQGERLYPPVSAPLLVSGLAFSPDGDRLAAVGREAHVQLFETSTGNPLLTLPTLGQNIGTRGWTPCVTFSPDSRSIVSLHLSKQANCWRIAADSGFPDPVRWNAHLLRRPLWHLQQSIHYASENRPETALFHLERVDGAEQHGPDFWRMKSQLLGTLGQSDLAIEAMTRSVEVCQQSPRSRWYYGRMLFHKKDYASALKELEFAATLYRNPPQELLELIDQCKSRQQD